MRALSLTQWKHPAELGDVAEPEPGPGQVVIRVAAAGACHSDLHLMHDFEEGVVPWSPPFVLGHENAGYVDQLGPGVSGFEVGQPVAVYGPWGCGVCRRCRHGFENYCENAGALPYSGGGLGTDGGMAPKMLIPSARFLVPLEGLDPIQAAPLTDAGLTPYHAIKRSLPKLVPGSTAVAIGVGGLGHLGVQILAATSPATVIAVDTRDEALDLAKRSGATHAVRSGPDAAAAIRDLTQGQGADAVFDFVGTDDTLALGAATSRVLGDLTIVGIGGGSLGIGFFSIPYEVSVATTYWGSLPELMEVIKLAEAGHVRAEISRFSLEGAPGAYEALRGGEVQGRAVVVPS